MLAYITTQLIFDFELVYFVSSLRRCINASIDNLSCNAINYCHINITFRLRIVILLI